MTEKRHAHLRLSSLAVTYGRAAAVADATLDVVGGRITALLGPNAAGKTSTLHGITGVVPASGSVVLDGDELLELSQARRARLGVALVPQGRQLFPDLTVEENLRIAVDLNRLDRGAVAQGLDLFPVLRERRRAPAGVLSGGQQQMLALARAIIVQPRVLLLDEAVDGLAAGTVRELMGVVTALANSGVAVLMAEPTAGPILEWVDDGYVLMRGHVLARGETREELEAAYEHHLGLTADPTDEGTSRPQLGGDTR
jgi:branched-chain amino acid transport system ATP-binding protein